MPSASELIVIIGAVASAAFAGPGEGLVREGNRAVEARDFQQALALYERAAEADPTLAEAFYNRGVALTLQEQFDAARELYRNADELALRDDVRVNARYNLAVGLYRAAQQAVSTDADAAIEQFREAARVFKDALKLDPSDEAAAHGVELSRKAIQLIRDQQALEEMLEQLAQEQEQQAQGSERQQQEGESPESQSEEQQQQQQQEQQGQQGQQRSQRQQDLQQRTRQAEQTLEESREHNVSINPELNKQAEDALEEAIEEQQRAQENLDQGKESEAQEHQQNAAEKLKEALERMQQSQDQSGQSQRPRQQRQQQNRQQQQQGPSEEEGDSEEDVDEITEQLLEKERAEHDMRRGHLEQFRRGVTPIEKDW